MTQAPKSTEEPLDDLGLPVRLEEADEIPSLPGSRSIVRKSYSVAEYEPLRIPMEDLLVKGVLDIYSDIKKTDYIKVYLKEGRLEFQAGGFVGQIPINDRVTIDVRPRVPIRSLERVLRVSGKSLISLDGYKRLYASHSETSPSLVYLLAGALVDAMRLVEEQGLIRQYFQVEGSTSFPKGRILVGSTIQRHQSRGAAYQVVAGWFENSVDNPLNRCVKYAVWYLAQRFKSVQLRTGGRKLIRDLNRIYNQLGGVKLDLSRQFMYDRFVKQPDEIPSLRSYYSHIIYTATTIIQNRGISLTEKSGSIAMDSLVVNMEDTFEAYVRNALNTGLQGLTSLIRVLDGNTEGEKFLFDQGFNDLAEQTKANPDIVIRVENADGSFTYPVVIDVKYKLIENLPKREDVNQILTYGFSYQAQAVVLIFPRSRRSRKGLSRLGRISNVVVYEYVFDLEAVNIEIEEQVFVDTIKGLLQLA